MTVRGMRIACWITKATNTHSKYVIIIAFPLQQWLHECASMLSDTYAACFISTHSWLALRPAAMSFPRYKSVGAWYWPLNSIYWNCTSTCSICPHGEDRHKFTFSLLPLAKTAGLWNVASLLTLSLDCIVGGLVRTKVCTLRSCKLNEKSSWLHSSELNT